MAKDSIIYDFTAGDTGSVLQVSIRDRYTKGLILLNGVYTATLLFKSAGGALQSRSMTILSGANDGKAEYQFQTGELTAGELETQVELTHTSSGKKVSELGIRRYQVGPKLT